MKVVFLLNVYHDPKLQGSVLNVVSIGSTSKVRTAAILVLIISGR